jgi:hypothetical protein
MIISPILLIRVLPHLRHSDIMLLLLTLTLFLFLSSSLILLHDLIDHVKQFISYLFDVLGLEISFIGFVLELAQTLFVTVVVVIE